MAFRDRINAFYERLLGKQDQATPAGSGNRPSDFVVRCGKCTSIGYFRDNNEDRIYIDEDRQLYIVADGMGGQAAGEQASQLAVDLISEKLQSLSLDREEPTEVQQFLSSAVVATNTAIMAQGMADPSLQNMGTTIVLGVIRAGKLYIAHVGDSRAYLLRDGQLESITTDHNLAQALYEAKTISKEELKTHKFRHVLWKYLGSKEAGEGPDLQALDVVAGDRIVLATDGLTGVLEDDVLQEELRRHDDPQKCADELVQLALEKGSKDNVTCVVLFVDAADQRDGNRAS